MSLQSLTALSDTQMIALEAYFDKAEQTINHFTKVVTAPKEIKARFTLVHYATVLNPKNYQILLDEFYPPIDEKHPLSEQVKYFRSQLAAINSICIGKLESTHTIYQHTFDKKISSPAVLELDTDSRKQIVSNYFIAQIQLFLKDHAFTPKESHSISPEESIEKYARISAKANQLLLTNYLESVNNDGECYWKKSSDDSTYTSPFTPYACSNSGSPISYVAQRTDRDPFETKLKPLRKSEH